MSLTPSEALPPTVLDQALLIVAVHADGTAYLSIDNGVDDAALADWLQATVDAIRRGDHRHGCPDCAAGVSHHHPPPG